MLYPIPSSFDDFEPIPLSPSELASSNQVPSWIEIETADPLDLLVNDQDFVNSCSSSDDDNEQSPFPVQVESNMSLSMLKELEPTPIMEKIQYQMPLMNMQMHHNMQMKTAKSTPSTISMDKPKRPLSAYNIFFQRERKALLNAQGKVGFAAMAKTISAKWKKMDAAEKEPLTQLAKADSARYQREMKVWKSQQEQLERSVVSPLGFDQLNQGIKTLDWSAFGAI